MLLNFVSLGFATKISVNVVIEIDKDVDFSGGSSFNTRINNTQFFNIREVESNVICRKYCYRTQYFFKGTEITYKNNKYKLLRDAHVDLVDAKLSLKNNCEPRITLMAVATKTEIKRVTALDTNRQFCEYDNITNIYDNTIFKFAKNYVFEYKNGKYFVNKDDLVDPKYMRIYVTPRNEPMYHNFDCNTSYVESFENCVFYNEPIIVHCIRNNTEFFNYLTNLTVVKKCLMKTKCEIEVEKVEFEEKKQSEKIKNIYKSNRTTEYALVGGKWIFTFGVRMSVVFKNKTTIEYFNNFTQIFMFFV